MKIKGEQYEVMKAAMKAVVEYYGKDDILGYYEGKSEVRLVWGVWHKAYNDLQYDDDHPFFKDGTWDRIHPHNPNFKLYVEGINDNHIQTALKKICKELGLL